MKTHLLMVESIDSRPLSRSRRSSASSRAGAMKGEVDRGLGAATSSWCSMRTLKSAPEAERFLTVLMASDVAVRFR